MVNEPTARELTDDELFLLQKARSRGNGYGLHFTHGVFRDRIGPLRDADQRLAAGLLTEGFLHLTGEQASADGSAMTALDAKLGTYRVEPAALTVEAQLATLRAELADLHHWTKCILETSIDQRHVAEYLAEVLGALAAGNEVPDRPF